MYIFESLRQEHDNIGNFVTDLENMLLDFMENNTFSAAKFYEAIHFIRSYADKQHHQKEEEILFVAMDQELDQIAKTIINNGMLVEHNLARGLVWDLEKYVKDYEADPTALNKLQIIGNGMGYVNLLRKHIDKENNVLYPYGEKNLSPETIAKLNEQAKIYDSQFVD